MIGGADDVGLELQVRRLYLLPCLQQHHLLPCLALLHLHVQPPCLRQYPMLLHQRLRRLEARSTKKEVT